MFILLRKKEVFIWCYIIFGLCGFIFHSVFIFALLILVLIFVHLDFNVVTLERQKQEVKVKLLIFAGFV